MKKISIDGLTNVLSPKEMKQVTGGVARYIQCCAQEDGWKEISCGDCALSNEWSCVTAMCDKYAPFFQHVYASCMGTNFAELWC